MCLSEGQYWMLQWDCKDNGKELEIKQLLYAMPLLFSIESSVIYSNRERMRQQYVHPTITNDPTGTTGHG